MDEYENISVPEFASRLNIDVRRARDLTKLKDDSLRPPGFRVGRQYRIQTRDLPEYLHDGRFARAMELVS